MLRKESKLTLNYSKCVFATRTVDLCGYRISRGFVQPDPERIKTHLTLLTLEKLKKQQRSIELFAYHPQWILSTPINLISRFKALRSHLSMKLERPSKLRKKS